MKDNLEDYMTNKYIKKLGTLIKSVLFCVGVFLIGGITAERFADILVNNREYKILLLIIIQGTIFVGIWYIVINRLSHQNIVKSVLTNIVIRKRSVIRGVYYGLISITASFIALVIFISFFNISREHEDVVADIIIGRPYVFIAVLIINLLFVAVSEELLFRSGVYEILKTEYSITTSAILSSLLFGSLHITKLTVDESTMFSALLPAIGGLVYVYSYEKHRNIFIPIISHTINNTIVLTLVFIFGT